MDTNRHESELAGGGTSFTGQLHLLPDLNSCPFVSIRGDSLRAVVRSLWLAAEIVLGLARFAGLIIVQRGIQARNDRSVDLDRFDSVQLDILPGQDWYHAGDLVFKLGTVETFRLEGVSRPESFRQVILKARMAHAGVKRSGVR